MNRDEKEASLSKVTAQIGVWSALAVAARIGKHVLIGPLQFVNLPLLFTMLAGMLYGSDVGFGVGFLSFLVSDSVIGLGIWTLVDGGLAGAIGAIWARLRIKERVFIFVVAYLSTFLYDILTSWILYLIFGFPPMEAFILGFVGLFLPVAGGGAIAIGPTTEATTSLLLSILAPRFLGERTYQ
ncbi:MAG: hypothetical protein QI197_04175 [Candidatus Korarchaeota archaeon]|nr:hypothetical protein [Candidatus Korarchaeota archaeon]